MKELNRILDPARRHNFLLLFDVIDGNPNGDPDADGAPRIDTITMQGMVTDVCLKRKIRNFAQAMFPDVPGMDLYVSYDRPLEEQHLRAYRGIGVDPRKENDYSSAEQARAIEWTNQQFFDNRLFGATMISSNIMVGKVRGPVVINLARTVVPMRMQEYAISRGTITHIEDAEEKSQTFGRPTRFPYALFRTTGHFNPRDAAKTGVSEMDLRVLWAALLGMWRWDGSAIRGDMSTLKLVIWSHDSPFGNASHRRLFDRVSVTQREGVRYPMGPEDFIINIEEKKLPKGVTQTVLDEDALDALLPEELLATAAV